MKAVNLEDFPTGNPFHHDPINVGMRLQDVLLGTGRKGAEYEGVYIMSAAFHRDYDFYIVDSKTGKRIGIKL
jgi:hypothetical protein